MKRRLSALRPRLFDEYVGQAKVREQLEIFIGAASLGKTTLSHIIAHELGVSEGIKLALKALGK